ncbi:MAG: glycosyltransferase [Elusimicrobiota bacterium]|jgi:glycosyltransferase involved in cell wall biosynthesis
MSPAPFTLFHIDGERGLRGGERQLLYLACRMREQGHANVIVCRRASALDAEAWHLGLERLHLPFLGELDPVSALMLRRRVGRAQAPMMHAHTAHAAALARLASLGSSLPWVAHRRVDFHLGPGSRLKYASARAWVAVSEGVRRVLLEDGLKPQDVRVVHDSLPVGELEARSVGLREPIMPLKGAERSDLRAALAREWGLPPGDPWVVNAAALVPHKDHETLLRAAAQVVARCPAARFVVMGEGPLRGALEALSLSLGLQGNLVFAGFRPDAVRCMKAFDLFTLSSWGEGMGSVLLEAMACGLPLVATRTGGIPEVLEDGVQGWLAPARDPRALAERILESIQDAEGSQRRGRAGLARVQSFSLAAAGEKMENIYREAAEQRSLRPIEILQSRP